MLSSTTTWGIGWKIHSIRDCGNSGNSGFGGNSVQIQEVYFYDSNSNDLSCGIEESSVATNPERTPSGEKVEKLCDGSSSTKWLDFTMGKFLF